MAPFITAARARLPLWGLLLAAVLALLTWVVSLSGAPAQAAGKDIDPEREVLVLERAQFHVGEAPPVAGAAVTEVHLPHAWGLDPHPAYDTAGWYVLRIHLAQAPRQRLAVMLPKASMNADLWLAGQMVGRQGRMDTPLTRHRNTPLLFEIPAQAWQAGENQLMVRVKSRMQYSGALGPVLVGPLDQLTREHNRHLFWGTTLRNFASSYAVALGFFVLLIWSRERTRHEYAEFALGSILVGLASLLTWMIDVPLSNDQWQRCVNMVYVWGYTFLVLFGLRFAGIGRSWAAPVFMGAAIVQMLVQILAPDEVYMRPYAAHGLVLALSGIMVLLVMLLRLQQRVSSDKWVFGPSLVCTALSGIHDWMYMAGHLPVTHFYALPYANVLLLSSIAWMIAGEYMRAHRDLQKLSRDLASTLKAREAELQASFRDLENRNRELAVAAERARILRDMHDGVGSHLTTAIRQLRSGRANVQDIEDVLRTSLDRLKLSIDSMTIADGDIGGLLANFRYRMQPRIEELGLSLHWHMDDLPLWPQGNQEALRHLQFILLEAWSNSLQHARATHLGLEGRFVRRSSGNITGDSRSDIQGDIQGDHIQVVLWDDGVGLRGEPRNGLKGMQERAALIGVAIRFESSGDTAGGGLRIVLDMPL